MKLFYELIEVHMPKPSVNFRDEDLTSFDVIMDQRRYNLQMASQIKWLYAGGFIAAGSNFLKRGSLWSVPEEPAEFENVKVYACSEWYNPLNGSIRNLLIQHKNYGKSV